MDGLADLVSAGFPPLDGRRDERGATLNFEAQTQDRTHEAQIRPLADRDLGDIVRIDEKISGRYRPDVWERRLAYYLRRDPDSSVVALDGDRVIGFMLGEVRSGEFGLEEPTGWIEVLGVDPEHRGLKAGKLMAEAMLRHFQQRGASCVRTLVDTEMKELHGFFSSLGFERASLQPYVKRF
jgi:ribosomal protein S18 acetylase RimI-like enzyme